MHWYYAISQYHHHDCDCQHANNYRIINGAFARWYVMLVGAQVKIPDMGDGRQVVEVYHRVLLHLIGVGDIKSVTQIGVINQFRKTHHRFNRASDWRTEGIFQHDHGITGYAGITQQAYIRLRAVNNDACQMLQKAAVLFVSQLGHQKFSGHAPGITDCYTSQHARSAVKAYI